MVKVSELSGAFGNEVEEEVVGMKYWAVMILGRNTFWTLELENSDDPAEEVERGAEELADRLGVRLLYVTKDKPE